MKLSHVAAATNSSWSAAGGTADTSTTYPGSDAFSAELDETKTN